MLRELHRRYGTLDESVLLGCLVLDHFNTIFSAAEQERMSRAVGMPIRGEHAVTQKRASEPVGQNSVSLSQIPKWTEEDKENIRNYGLCVMCGAPRIVVMTFKNNEQTMEIGCSRFASHDLSSFRKERDGLDHSLDEQYEKVLERAREIGAAVPPARKKRDGIVEHAREIYLKMRDQDPVLKSLLQEAMDQTGIVWADITEISPEQTVNDLMGTPEAQSILKKAGVSTSRRSYPYEVGVNREPARAQCIPRRTEEPNGQTSTWCPRCDPIAYSKVSARHRKKNSTAH